MAKLVDVLTPEKVLEFYRSTGKRPGTDSFFPDDTSLNCCCPLGAAICATGGVPFGPDNNEMGASKAGLALGVEDEEELWQFTMGFDRVPFKVPSSPSVSFDSTKESVYRDAYDLGVRVRNFLQIHYGPIPDISGY